MGQSSSGDLVRTLDHSDALKIVFGYPAAFIGPWVLDVNVLGGTCQIFSPTRTITYNTNKSFNNPQLNIGSVEDCLMSLS